MTENWFYQRLGFEVVCNFVTTKENVITEE